MPDEPISKPPTIAILTPAELLKLKADGAEGVRRTRFSFHRGGSFDVTALRKAEGLALVVVCAVPAKNLTAEQLKTIGQAHAAETAKLAAKVKAEPK